MRRTLITLGISAVALIYGHAAHAAIRYVATNGSDTGNTCLSSASPCASIARCVSQMTGGDTCTVADGEYTDPVQALASQNCTAANPCTIRSTNQHGAVLVFTSAGPCCSTGSYAIHVTGNHWVIDGFKVQANYQRGFVRGLGSTGLVFKNNRVEISPYYGDSALMVSGTSDVSIQDNWVHHYPGCVNDAVRCSSGGYDSCDFVENPAGVSYLNAEFYVKDSTNVVFEGNDYGHMRNSTSFNNITGLTIRKNRCVNATNHGCFIVNDARSVLIENNIGDIDTDPACTTVNQPAGGEVLQASLWDSYCAADVTIRNNTVVGHGIGWEQQLFWNAPNQGAASACGDGSGPNVCANGGCYQGFKVYNNIVYHGKSGSQPVGISLGSSAAYGGAFPRWRSDHNVFYETSGRCIAKSGSTTYCSLGQWQAVDFDGDGVAEDPNGRYQQPVFVSYAGHDYRAASQAAPQVNAGANGTVNGVALACPTEDFDGNPRTDGLCDVGAFEYQAANAPTDTQAPTAPTNLSASISLTGFFRSVVIAMIDSIARLLSW